MSWWIDYTQFSTFQRCPWLWYERYVQAHAPAPPEGQRDDALCIGQLVHAGIENYIRNRQPAIPQRAIDETTPAPEALTMAREMVQAYVQAFPIGSDPWEVEVVEGLVGDLIRAKVDALVRVPRPMDVPDGLGGHLSLNPGLWVLEHKTTSDRTPPAAFMGRWVMDRQADFQMLAVSDARGVTPLGVIINVIVKPGRRLQTRQCRACNAYTPVEAIDWARPACQSCGKPQRWNPPRPTDPPRVWRFAVTRDPARLRLSRSHITAAQEAMARMRDQGLEAMIPNFAQCVDPWWRLCPYFNLHAHGHDPSLIPINPFSYAESHSEEANEP